MTKLCYLSGPITGHPDYREAFAAAEATMQAAGWAVLNPARLWPEGLEYEQYLQLDFAIIEQTDLLVMLDGWLCSRGCGQEVLHAMARGVPMSPLGAFEAAAGGDAA